ncbi:MAG: glutamate-5-semialdehyde dehydrogenase [Elusimicrobiota bacterium]|jgi:glutamate-5-semialdehyde dehydrogenase|nr:glutamate-5-semialdehyde dehydrogenase [Elusimicrobiota bacterium]
MIDNAAQNIIIKQAQKAKKASVILASMNEEIKNNILLSIAQNLSQNAQEILFHNEIDIAAAKESGLSVSMLDRLSLNQRRIDDMRKGVEKLTLLKDPIGEIIEHSNPIEEMDIKKVRVPLGVIAMIYEARPNVTVDAASLCLKSGNAVILKGGSEAINSNRILAKTILSAAIKAGLPDGAIEFIDTLDRNAVFELLKLDNYIDLIIPRGGEDLVNFVRKNSTIAVLSHGKGLCHLYIDKDADIDMALKIAVNAKCQRPSVCNSIETLLVHSSIANTFLSKICALYYDKGVIIKGCRATKSIINSVESADETDWNTEYHDLIISIKVIDSCQEAIEHINKYGSKHSDAIITKNKEIADKFIMEVDSAAVFANASTRLHDGGVFGLGSEIGISTQKLHARGVMGIKELTTTKYIVIGNGNIRQ